jgi:hypothetical protein
VWGVWESWEIRRYFWVRWVSFFNPTYRSKPLTTKPLNP